MQDLVQHIAPAKRLSGQRDDAAAQPDKIEIPAVLDVSLAVTVDLGMRAEDVAQQR